MAPRGIIDPDRDGVPKEVWQAFQAHRDNSRRRGIAFEFDVFQWWDWWQIDNRWANRGMGKDKFVMSRIGDKGPYSPENVVCKTHTENRAETRGRPRKPNGSRRKPLTTRSSYRVRTPIGDFDCPKDAARELGFSKQHISRMAKAGTHGFAILPKAE